MKLIVAVVAVVGSDAWLLARHRKALSAGPACRVAPLWSRTPEDARRERNEGDEEWSDFDDLGFSSGSSASDSKFIPGDDDKVDTGAVSAPLPDFAKLLNERSGTVDWTAIQTRQFSLGQDLILSNYVGNMGFDEVTDWEYYYPSADEDDDARQVVQPNPFDASKYVLY